MAEKNYADALLDVLRTCMDEDPQFAVMGNEVLGIGPEAPQFEPFQKEYGDRIFFPPTSEAGFTALAAGAAMCGRRVFCHLGLASFTYPAFSSIINEIAPARLSSGGAVSVPTILHISHGLLHGGGGQHSESPLSMYWNVPGHRDRRAVGPARGQGPRARRVQVGQPDDRDHPRVHVRRDRRGAGRGLRAAVRQGRGQARGLRRDDRGLLDDGRRRRWRRPSSSPARASRPR